MNDKFMSLRHFSRGTPKLCIIINWSTCWQTKFSATAVTWTTSCCCGGVAQPQQLFQNWIVDTTNCTISYPVTIQYLSNIIVKKWTFINYALSVGVAGTRRQHQSQVPAPGTTKTELTRNIHYDALLEYDTCVLNNICTKLTWQLHTGLSLSMRDEKHVQLRYNYEKWIMDLVR